jgi:NADPH-dependent 2,4-dienoyl-CoA reductase/sulfur reductase-like enzyme
MSQFDCLIVGAGHAGAQAAILLRQLKYEGSVAIIGAETELPYERPPLSKDYLAGEKPFERIMLRPPAFWSERAVEMILGERVTSLDPMAHSVRTSAGRDISYGKLIWCGGGAARPLSCPGSAAAGLFTVRTRADADALMAMLPAVKRIVVIGGGYIGLEAAAVLTKLGKQVTLVEAMVRVLARTAGQDISDFYAAEHRAHGVDVRLAARVEAIEMDADDRATGPLLLAGAAGGDGVDVDGYCRTSLEDIYAVGDCAAHENRFANGQRIRLESVQNANDQARVAVQHIIGETTAYDAMPWFWSNQYDLKLQTVGLSTGHDQTVMRGDPVSRSFSVVYLREGHVIALDCVNLTKDYVQGRAHILSGCRLDLTQLADPAIPLKEVDLA